MWYGFYGISCNMISMWSSESDFEKWSKHTKSKNEDLAFWSTGNDLDIKSRHII